MASEPTTRRFTVEEYHRMAEVGILGVDDRVELLDGEIVQMSPIGSRHAASVARLTRKLGDAARDRAIVWVQNPIRLTERSEPQPDVCLLQPRTDFYAEAHPSPGDVLLVVEVADTSVAFDRDVKLPLYARSGVPEVWIVDLAARRIHVHRDPLEDGYGTIAVLEPDSELSAVAFPGVKVRVGELLP